MQFEGKEAASAGESGVSGTVPTASARERAFEALPLAPEIGRPPVVVVGLPRSGTKFLTHVMNHIRGLYVFDDLYYFREARGVRAGDTLDRDQKEHLIRWLAARSMPEQAKVNLHRHALAAADVERLAEAVSTALSGDSVPLQAPLEEWMNRLALLNGCTHWGYKAPQDFMILDQLADVFPGVRFLFIYRDPRAMMASYKFVPDQYGDARQYHAVPYALYWRMAHRTIAEKERVHPIHHVKFESLVGDPQGVGKSIADFLDLPWQEPRIPEKVNTSFGSRDRADITPTERWICERLAGDAMRRAGYEVGEGRLRLQDLPDLCSTTLHFAFRQGWKAITTPRKRASAWMFLRRLAGRAEAPRAIS